VRQRIRAKFLEAGFSCDRRLSGVTARSSAAAAITAGEDMLEDMQQTAKRVALRIRLRDIRRELEGDW
jgi:hypothetical protein